MGTSFVPAICAETASASWSAASVPDALARAEAICARLRERGAANLFGPQRFGKRGDNAALGHAILLRETQVRDRFLRRIALSALQSELFNRCLAARIADGLFGTAIEGDVLKKRATGGLFVSTEPDTDARRVAAFEVDPAGPLPGHSLFAAQGEALRREQAILSDAGVDPACFVAGGAEMEGARRPYRIAPEELRVEAVGLRRSRGPLRPAQRQLRPVGLARDQQIGGRRSGPPV